MSEIVPVFGFSLDLLLYMPEASEKSQFNDLLNSLERKITENPFVFIFNFRSKGSFKNLQEYLKDDQTPNTPIIDLLVENQKVGTFKKQFVEIFHVDEIENIDSEKDLTLELMIEHILRQSEAELTITEKLSYVDFFLITENQKKIIEHSPVYTHEQQQLLFRFIKTLREAKESGFLEKWEGGDQLDTTPKTSAVLNNLKNIIYYSKKLYLIDDFIEPGTPSYKNLKLLFDAFVANEVKRYSQNVDAYEPTKQIWVVRWYKIGSGAAQRELFTNPENKDGDLKCIKSFCEALGEELGSLSLSKFSKACVVMFLKNQHKRGIVGDFNYILHDGYQDKIKANEWYEYSLSSFNSFSKIQEKHHIPSCFAMAELNQGVLEINPKDSNSCRYDSANRKQGFRNGEKILRDRIDLFK